MWYHLILVLALYQELRYLSLIISISSKNNDTFPKPPLGNENTEQESNPMT